MLLKLSQLILFRHFTLFLRYPFRMYPSLASLLKYLGCQNLTQFHANNSFYSYHGYLLSNTYILSGPYPYINMPEIHLPVWTRSVALVYLIAFSSTFIKAINKQSYVSVSCFTSHLRTRVIVRCQS